MTLSKDVIESSHKLVVDTFLGFRDELLASYGNVSHSRKYDASVVTELDLKVEKELRHRLESAFPTVGFHGEETGNRDGESGALWIVDPIDGTSSFIHGLPGCTNMAALVDDGDIVASVIYDFVSDDLYTAFKGAGAKKNGEPISINDVEAVDSFIFSNSTGYDRVRDLLSPYGTKVFAPVGAMGYHFLLIAQGNIQGFVQLAGRAQIHDNAPGALLIQEAGAVIVPYEPGEYTYKMLNFIACTPKMAEVFEKERAAIEASL